MNGSMNLRTCGQGSWSSSNLNEREARGVILEWMFQGRVTQQPPPGEWHTWLILGGRGSGKTRMGAEWVNGVVHAFPPFATAKSCNLALVGETLADVREIMVDGPSGIVAVSRAFRRSIWTRLKSRIRSFSS